MEHILWHDRYEEDWLRAFPLGNGRIATMVYGGPEKEILQLNEESLWSGKQMREEYSSSPEILAIPLWCAIIKPLGKSRETFWIRRRSNIIVNPWICGRRWWKLHTVRGRHNTAAGHLSTKSRMRCFTKLPPQSLLTAGSVWIGRRMPGQMRWMGKPCE